MLLIRYVRRSWLAGMLQLGLRVVQPLTAHELLMLCDCSEFYTCARMVPRANPRIPARSLGDNCHGVAELALVACSGVLSGPLDRGVPRMLTLLLWRRRVLRRWLQLGVLLAPESACIAQQCRPPAPPCRRLACAALLTLQQHLAENVRIQCM